MSSKRKFKSDIEGKKSCEVVTLNEKIKIVEKLRGGVCAVAVGRPYFHFEVQDPIHVSF
jgi:hypothetical protein